MLRIYPVLVQLVRDVVRPRLVDIERHDRDLGKQCRAAASSAVLNLGEGSYSRGGTRTARYRTAVGSLREVLSCFEVAAALGYMPEVTTRFGGASITCSARW
jgi:four helix bundle protein